MGASEPSGAACATRVAIIMDGDLAVQRGWPVPPRASTRRQDDEADGQGRLAPDSASSTVYAFSTENWSRPSDEVAGLMEMFAELIVSETPELDEEGVRMRFVGSRRGVSDSLLEQMDWAETETAANARLTLFVAFNYGGRAEILDAAERYEGGGEEAFAKLLYAPEMSDPDLVIRTSGEKRLSNFLLWQSAYSEFLFSDVLWPDFDRAELEAALREYASRQRRFGARE